MRRAAAAALVAVLATVAPVRAEPTEAARRADALFQEGRTLTLAGRHADACPKFEESQRLDPGLGTLLNLAACYEATGKLASAWTAFRSAEDQARESGEKKREQTARARARALEPRVARLTLTLAAGDRPVGFAVTRDGVPVAALDFGRRLPVDPGVIVIEATAPGYRRFRLEVEVAGEKVAREVDIPALAASESALAPTAAPVVARSLAPPPGPAAPRPRLRSALIVGGVGVAGLAVGIGLGLSARSKYDAVGCTAGAGAPTGCTTDEAAAIDAARSRGNLGTLVGALGVAALGAGVVLWWTAPREAITVHPTIDAAGGGVTVAGRF